MLSAVAPGNEANTIYSHMHSRTFCVLIDSKCCVCMFVHAMSVVLSYGFMVNLIVQSLL